VLKAEVAHDQTSLWFGCGDQPIAFHAGDSRSPLR